ncbi:hypothetical protein PV387_34260 [Streptomyces sp. ME02-6987-2C]|uniref:hypothetical protein n=1 Tax=unclassified Streptomyces TaxID=2593676 RepID=UPI0029B8017C|nr:MULTISPECIES: hypothetical protein [unclassified Streptomyces]MDX3371009.1 hypothetical protein [Streptomyces sp. ME02-6987-2C]MDX3426942.1 hypothetical protein [Streptomyces sp. ME02-6985-2c]
MLTDQYVKDHGHLPSERGRHQLGWWAAQETRPAKKKPKPLQQLLAWWRASAILRFGQQLIDSLLDRCRAAGAAIRARVDPTVDVALAAVDVAAVVFTVREKFSRRHILAEARRHLLETLRGRESFTRGLDDYITHRALLRYSRRHTVTKPGREAPAADRMTYTADFPVPNRWWIAPAEGTQPRESSRYERARVASLAVQNEIRDARIRADTATANEATASASSVPADHRDLEGKAASAPHAVDHSGRGAALSPAQRAAAVQAHQQAAMPEEYLEGRTTDPATWLHTPKNRDRLAAFARAADTRRRACEARPKSEQPADVVKPADQQQHHANRPDHGRGAGRER